MYQQNDRDFPPLNGNNVSRQWIGGNDFEKRLEEMEMKVDRMGNQLERMIHTTRKIVEQQETIQNMVIDHKHLFEVHQMNISLLQDFVNVHVIPVCQVIAVVVPLLVEKQILDDKSVSSQSLTAICFKFLTDHELTWKKSSENKDKEREIQQEGVHPERLEAGMDVKTSANND
ncbi:unnamed protein product [Didymodactylos carnosus]|uniref:Uncharacterized protein n=1 Tax=Didymodactylos carnosus TaxID=1234261 RepID=A0A815XLS5_9BILA|nr:unnamed protein product [Didymodactylos carnosus]CAF4420339.1 unnamed protein product [Didymodactylos carnosus]